MQWSLGHNLTSLTAYNKGDNMDRQDRTPAKWTLVKENGINRLYQSEGGAVKITRENQDGEERVVIMLPARQFGDLAAVTEFITECSGHVVEQHKRYKAEKDKAKIALQAQGMAAKLVESLKATGLTPEQIAQIVAKQAA